MYVCTETNINSDQHMKFKKLYTLQSVLPTGYMICYLIYQEININEKHNSKACEHVMIKVTKQKPWKGTSMQSLPSTRAGIGGTERKMEDFHNNKLHN